MIDVGIIGPVEESKWISLMVVQNKKTGEIWICVDLRNLNEASLHGLFLKPFNDEVLEGVGGQEIYSFTDGFFGYHQRRIAKEHRHMTTFITEWGCFQYTVMLFGLKNAATIFSRLVVIQFKEFIHKFMEIYMDDWIIYGPVKDHTVNLRLMLKDVDNIIFR